jgi:hypothetical protein
MYVRSVAIAFASAIALNLPAYLAPRFTLETSGAVHLTAAGHDARCRTGGADVADREHPAPEAGESGSEPAASFRLGAAVEAGRR